MADIPGTDHQTETEIEIETDVRNTVEASVRRFRGRLSFRPDIISRPLYSFSDDVPCDPSPLSKHPSGREAPTQDAARAK